MKATVRDRTVMISDLVMIGDTACAIEKFLRRKQRPGAQNRRAWTLKRASRPVGLVSLREYAGTTRGQRPVARRREEPEVSGRRRRHLGGELTSGVQQPHVGAADRLLAAQYLPLDHRFLVDVHALEVEAALLSSAHVSGLSGFVAEGNGYADQRTPLGPGTVVVLHVRLAEDLVQHEPGVRRPLADAAVGDGVLAEVDAGVGVQLPQLVVGTEGAVVVGRLAPR